MTKLTSTQQKVLQYVRQRIESGEPAPTYRELCFEFGWRSTGTARDHLKALVRKGYLELSGGRARAVCLKERGREVSQIPLVGRVVAGTPVYSEESLDAFIPLPADWIHGRSCFAVRVYGDSMQDAGILDGDYAIAAAGQPPMDDDIVIATLNGETTLKRLQKRESRWFLVAANKNYSPIQIQADSTIIQGVMVALLRRAPHRRALTPAS